MNRVRFAAVLVIAFCFAGPGLAQPPGGNCQISHGLGASLLFPYFELDIANPLNVTTVLSINSGWGLPVLTRVVFWTDWGVPTIAFDVYLDSFAVQSLNVRDIFNGFIPSTGARADLSGFPFCNALPPFHSNPALSAPAREQLSADHRGVDGPLADDCVGSPHPDQVARGYITVDVVDECSGVEVFNPTYTPANTTYPYFANGTGAGIAIDDNRLWGDIVYIDAGNAAAQGSEAIALWADPDRFSGTSIFTFYGRFSSWDGRDDRVPLPRTWNQRFLNGGSFSGGADIILWRDTGVPIAHAACGSAPAWYPLRTSTQAAIDEDGDNLFDFGNDRFPVATQRLDVASLGIPYSFGWTQIGTAGTQTWVQPTLSAAGLFSASWNGTPIAFNCGAHP
ncbi:MAG: hypothetical protein ABI639_17035 [Thermoanaerobaculia bacterium]